MIKDRNEAEQKILNLTRVNKFKYVITTIPLSDICSLAAFYYAQLFRNSFLVIVIVFCK